MNNNEPEPGIATFLLGVLTIALFIGLIYGTFRGVAYRIEKMRTMEVSK